MKAVHAEVECVDNGEAALSRYQNMPDYYYDMIFMDLNMPIMDGYEAAKSIRGSEKPDASDIPILAVTANAMAKDIVKVHEAGMNERITKPVQRELLYQTMENIFCKKGQEHIACSCFLCNRKCLKREKLCLTTNPFL